MRQRHIFGNVFTLESIVAGCVSLVILGVVARVLLRRRSAASDRPERVVAAGHSAQGLAMIVGMLPIGIAAAAVTWSWVNREEREAREDSGFRAEREREARGVALPAPRGDPLAR
ncbi:hypothetical protein FB563_6799 [Streptomyces puniciscabiei]|uniref:Uncharacterized protein n=1 Tax=Streptomyces puniciscabiei TaxID=164348 RepID=A0A542TIH2_9ACTN|nr:hypothetical protein [Streptomyces puniciscabiei]TQK86652.1 hypothetical protein FB563_6799 [Streptomyces puniciscabiei]